MKDILIVTQDSLSIMEILRCGIKSCTGLAYDYIDHEAIRKSFKYENFGHRAKNFFLKNLSGRNLKVEYYNASVENAMKELQPSYKKILVIRPDLLTDQHLQILRSMTGCFIAYYWDTVGHIPRKMDITHYFDRILSFDPEDCKQYGFEFQPNFYYYESQENEILYQVYNLSSLDKRKEIIEEVGAVLEALRISFLFKGFRSRAFKSNYIQPTSRITYRQMITEIMQCNVVLDITKKGQHGLTFRPFEALGLNKKLITTNAKIREYPFYHPDNILVIDSNNLHIDPDFFDKPLMPVHKFIKDQYHIKNWLANVLG